VRPARRAGGGARPACLAQGRAFKRVRRAARARRAGEVEVRSGDRELVMSKIFSWCARPRPLCRSFKPAARGPTRTPKPYPTLTSGGLTRGAARRAGTAATSAPSRTCSSSCCGTCRMRRAGRWRPCWRTAWATWAASGSRSSRTTGARTPNERGDAYGNSCGPHAPHPPCMRPVALAERESLGWVCVWR